MSNRLASLSERRRIEKNWALSFFGGKSVYAGAQIRVDLAVAKVGCAPRFSGISCSLECISVVFGLLILLALAIIILKQLSEVLIFPPSRFKIEDLVFNTHSQVIQ